MLTKYLSKTVEVLNSLPNVYHEKIEAIIMIQIETIAWTHKQVLDHMQVMNGKGLVLARHFANLLSEIPCFLEDKALNKMVDLIDPIITLVTVLVKLTRWTSAFTA